ncbi:hypothetical protein MPH_12748 [Macrophomina phaseolina MS6]|uniref:DUF6594 domain-containing protein n=1 Tax=Macrophomina phaseolina (strain MS6) TaxID=1126212 RepID=K2R7A3_MACPH|nr:hypothetical protein MPH_12748 [Macrophomina phaseolina MS6]
MLRYDGSALRLQVTAPYRSFSYFLPFFLSYQSSCSLPNTVAHPTVDLVLALQPNPCISFSYRVFRPLKCQRLLSMSCPPARSSPPAAPPSLSSLSAHGNNQPPRNGPADAPREEEPIEYGPEHVQYHPQGHPRLAAFLNSDENFFICRRYGLLHARVMLYLQDELRELQGELLELDAEDAGSADPFILHSRQYNDQRNGERKELIHKINEKLKEYGEGTLLLFDASETSDLAPNVQTTAWSARAPWLNCRR